MSTPRARLLALRSLIEATPPFPEQGAWMDRLDAVLDLLPAGIATPAVAAVNAELERMRQDVEDAEHARDAANLQRMKVAGQLNTLHKSLAAAAPQVSSGKDAQSDALRRIEWLVQHESAGIGTAAAVKAAEMEAPMPSRAVLEAVVAGERKFTKAQLEFSIAEAMVLTGWAETPLELQAHGEPWIAALILKNHGESTPVEYLAHAGGDGARRGVPSRGRGDGRRVGRTDRHARRRHDRDRPA